MTRWDKWNWILAGLGLTQLVCFSCIGYGESIGAASWTIGFTLMVIGVEMCVALALVLLPYCILTKRWGAMGFACLGALLHYPTTPLVAAAWGWLRIEVLHASSPEYRSWPMTVVPVVLLAVAILRKPKVRT